MIHDINKRPQGVADGYDIAAEQGLTEFRRMSVPACELSTRQLAGQLMGMTYSNGFSGCFVDKPSAPGWQRNIARYEYQRLCEESGGESPAGGHPHSGPRGQRRRRLRQVGQLLELVPESRPAGSGGLPGLR